jgi:DsbC/DsbD-like thiol-disulfide interchange protein
MMVFRALPSRRALLLAFAALPAIGGRAFAQTSGWSQSPQSRARLISAGGLREGRYLAGVEIQLQPRFMTYWRMPGDGGLAPTFRFEGSRNLKRADVLYPAPNRYQIKKEEAFGYRNEVVFPVWIEPVAPSLPVTLSLALDYATCEEICIPASAQMTSELRPTATSTAATAVLDKWLSMVPQAFTGKITLTRRAAKEWLIAPDMDQVLDIFAEGPEGWYFETRPIEGGFLLRAVEQPANAEGAVALRLTLVSAKAAYETQASLDLRA